jgi:hypothetical protein
MVLLAMGGGGSAFASPLLVDRGLPTANLNDAAGSNRSNVAWALEKANQGWGVGDDFTIGRSGSYRIDTLRLWVVGEALGVGESPYYAGTTFTLWGSSDFGQKLSTSALLMPATYADGSSYQNGGYNFALYSLEFKNLNWLVDGDSWYNFGVTGKDAKGKYQQVFEHASNADQGDSPADAADGWLIGFRANDPGNFYYWTSDPAAGGTGWNKYSDLNVQLEGTPVPEPSSMFLLGVGLFGLTVVVKRSQKQC